MFMEVCSQGGEVLRLSITLLCMATLSLAFPSCAYSPMSMPSVSPRTLCQFEVVVFYFVSYLFFRFDKGEVLSRREVEISPNETAPHLRTRLSDIGGEELLSCIQRLPQCLEDARPQPEDGVTYGKLFFYLSFNIVRGIPDNVKYFLHSLTYFLYSSKNYA